ncbi:class C beta-lactamase-related serine hydrolase [Burkholderia sp. Bp9012]|uniref:serine hydrolase domain-containing protein n=1 Tax=Burkholderia sp. Bp9012 TaxID=2184562 RepID=UPI000F5AC911|nr:serine hydrolase [Burkholderia sp. Bp9012]RQR71612.1 class C beta-lactamase-related serine hydrolase [Burkholderia sp. Bp9012]
MSNEQTIATATTRPRATQDAPSERGFMVGFPPPPEARFGPGSMSNPLHMRWAFQNMSQLYNSVPVSRGEGPILPIEWGQPLDVESLQVPDVTGTASMQDVYRRYGTDALLVLHQGKLVFERYLGDMRAPTQHALFSCTKSFVGLLTEMLIQEERIDRDARAHQYVPELAASALGSATVQQLQDMRASAKFFGHARVKGEIQADYIQAVMGGISGISSAASSLQGAYQVLRSAEADLPHGGPVRYDNSSTDTLGWILRRVSGQSNAQMLSERIWVKLGAEQDAAMLLDCSKAEWAAAGLTMCARDVARFAEMIRHDGRYNGQQIVAPGVIAEIKKSGDRDAFAKGGFCVPADGSYHNQWWFYHDRHQSYGARGQFGQRIWIAPQAETTIVQFATDPQLGDEEGTLLLSAYHVIADTLQGRG